MNPAPPSPRVTTKEAQAAMASTVAFIRDVSADLVDARQQLAELEATIANDQGRGEPPSPGWVFDGDIHWTQPFGPRVTGGVVGEWLIEDATGPGDAWVVIGRARTARRAMRDTDAARGPG